MKSIFTPRMLRSLALTLLLSISIELLWPLQALALTSGPSQPEFSSFEPASTANMVNEFSGAFTYNIPLLNVPGPQGSGYPISLSYHSGASPEEEASWVGYGWTLNTGAITRNTRGFPDDYNGDIVYHNKTPKNWTATLGVGAGIEGFSFDNLLMPSGNAAIRYNNYTGFGYNAGIGISTGRGTVSLGFNVADGQGSFSAAVNPVAALNGFKHEKPERLGEALMRVAGKHGSVKADMSLKGAAMKALSGASSIGGSGSIFSFSEISRPTQAAKYDGLSTNVALGLQVAPGPAPLGGTFNTIGSYSYQINAETQQLQARGFMYSSDTGDGIINDYTVEKETPYNKRDNFLGMPLNGADNFMVSGEGIGGGFRLYHKTTGTFGPNTEKNKIDIRNIAGEATVGWTLGLGADIGGGEHSLEETAWGRTSAYSNPEAATAALPDYTDEPVYFRFNHDLGSGLNDVVTDAPVRAGITLTGAPGLREGTINRPSDIEPATSTSRGRRAAYIGYHTNQEMAAAYYKAYSRRADIEAMTDRALAPKGIGEMAVFTEQGNRYVYGLPVYARKEETLQYGVQGISGSNLQNRYLAFSSNEDTKVGEVRNGAYASTYLLTEITTPDYVDTKFDGPDKKDYGGYTRFNYKKEYGTGKPGGWYPWRAPFLGRLYQRNSLSDAMDDMGSVARGEKEIIFLQSIETKTHAAIFTTETRDDGLSALPDGSGLDPNITKSLSEGQKGSLKKQLKLKQIDLYAIEDVYRVNGQLVAKSGAKPIKTVRLKYADNNRLCGNLPNALAAGGGGKLTLEKVWFEYQGLDKTGLISPYTFEYAYPLAAYANYPAIYKSQSDPEKNLTTGYQDYTAAQQNPDYSPFDLDAWGSYQKNGAGRFDNLKTWVNQEPVAGFDPAAWQLKVIRLPSGGEIHVQYEQNDYAYVQDQPAHVLAPLNSYNGSGKFYINTDRIGLSANNPDGNQLEQARDMLDNYYLKNPAGNPRIYFKMLYRLTGSGPVGINECNVDYITGYARVTGVGIENNSQLYVQIESSADNLPQKVCTDFFRTQRSGKTQPGGNCDPAANGISNSGDDAEVIATSLLGWAKSLVAPACTEINPELSYLRIPYPANKKGAGVRVKRLLTFDAEAELDGKPVLYGNEYVYETKDKNRWRSSGVATNEPQAIREENPLVRPLARKGQSDLSKLLAGRDMKQTEGPLAESLLPGPSVGYSRVTIKNIHSGKTTPGFTVKEFYTAKDFPAVVRTTNLYTRPDAPPALTTGIINVMINRLWATQGFSVVLNNMHGQLKGTSTYAGTYSRALAERESKAVLAGRQTYEYFLPGRLDNGKYKEGDKVPMVSASTGLPVPEWPGKETDVTMAGKAVKDRLVDGTLEGDAEFAVLPLIPPIPVWYATFKGSLTKNTADLYTHATTKVVRYPAILKKITTIQDGVEQTTEYTAFDRNTGQATATRTTDEYKGSYLKQDVQAAWEYPRMQGRYAGENLKITNIIGGGYAVSTNAAGQTIMQLPGLSATTALPLSACDFITPYTKGDLLDLTDNNNQHYLFHAGAPNYELSQLPLYPVAAITSGTLSGTPPAAFQALQITILRTGRTNQLNLKAGSVTYHTAAGTPQLPVQAGYTGASPGNFAALLYDVVKGAPLNNGVKDGLLAGPFPNINLAEYRHKLPAELQAKPYNLTIKQVKVVAKRTNEGVTVQLTGFDVLTSAGYMPVK